MHKLSLTLLRAFEVIKFMKLFLLICCFISSATAYESGKIALVQYDADKYFNQYQVNKKNLTAFAKTAIKNQANIIVFPEGSLYGYASTSRELKWCSTSGPRCDDVREVAEVVPSGPSTKYWEQIAEDNSVYILFNLPEKSGSVFYNTTVIVGPQGYVGKYRKRSLYSTDTYYAKAGKDSYVLETPYGQFGLLICMDASYPGHLENYKKEGVDAVILMMDWDDSATSSSGAKNYFRRRSNESELTIYASDMSLWDGTGKYAPGLERERSGLGAEAIGIDGISYHQL